MQLIQQFKTQFAKFLVAFISISLLANTYMPALVHAATPAYVPPAKVSFTFDDGLSSAYTDAAPTLAAHGLSGTDYIITGCVGMTTVPNTCHANTATTYMTWAQIQALKTTYNWELGSHTVDHQCLASNAKVDKDDCQTNTLTTAQVDTELSSSQATLATNGITATDFAPPYGDYNMPVLKEIAKYYSSMRNFRNDAGSMNVWPYSDYYLQDLPVQETVNTVANIKSKIDAAVANHQWLVLSFHDIKQTPSQVPDDYEYGTAELDQIAAYAQTKVAAGQLQSVTVNQALALPSANILPNASFNSGLTGGWRTDDATRITVDSAGNGSYPDPTYSVKLTSGTTGKNAHLFSPLVSVNANTTYELKNFLNVQALTTGMVGFYIDEYDANGNWISGQYKGGENSVFVESMNYAYVPSSVNVSKASLQVIVSGTGITAYLDNSQWAAVNSGTVTPPTNLVANGTFDAGIGSGWTTNSPANITADSTNHGSPSNPVNSVKLTDKATNSHLFSPLVSVSSTKTYSLTSYLNLQALTSGEVGFYIDEYNASGGWISGQYKGGVHALGAGDAGFSYTPSSATVAKASLQIIVVANSGTLAYIDDIRWYQN